MKKILIFLLLLVTITNKVKSTYTVYLNNSVCSLQDAYHQDYPSKKILAEAERVVNTFTLSDYDYNTFINVKAGVYKVDCSSFLSYVLAISVYDWYEKIYAHAVLSRFPSTKNNPTLERCLAKDFYSFFKNYNNRSDKYKGWEIISGLNDLNPGDIIAIKYEDGASNTGHVLILAGEPIQLEGFSNTPVGYTEFLVKIIDSSASPHGTSTTYWPRVRDTRTDNSKNVDEGGVGMGYMILGTKDTDTEQKIQFWRRSNLSGSVIYRNDPSNLSSGSYTTRPILFGRAVPYDNDPEKYSNYYGVNMDRILPYKTLDTTGFTGGSEESGDQTGD